MENKQRDELNINITIVGRLLDVCSVHDRDVLVSFSVPRSSIEQKGFLDITTCDSRFKLFGKKSGIDYDHVGNKNYLFKSIDKRKLTNYAYKLQNMSKSPLKPSGFVLKTLELNETNRKLVINNIVEIGFYDKKSMNKGQHYEVFKFLFGNIEKVKGGKVDKIGGSCKKVSLIAISGCKNMHNLYQIIYRLRRLLKPYPIYIKSIGHSYKLSADFTK